MWFSLFHQSVFPGKKNHIFWSSSLVFLTWVQEGCRRPEDTLVASSQLWGHLDQATRTDTEIKAGVHRWNTNSEPKSEEGSKQVFIPDDKDTVNVTNRAQKLGTERLKTTSEWTSSIQLIYAWLDTLCWNRAITFKGQNHSQYTVFIFVTILSASPIMEAAKVCWIYTSASNDHTGMHTHNAFIWP